MPRPTTLWRSGPALDRRMLAYTADADRPWDARLLRWDVLGSLGHIESLRAGKLLTGADYIRLRRGLRSALAAADDGTLAAGPRHEDIHTAVEYWLTRRLPGTGERLHTGRSRNDQVACDVRLYLKDQLLTLHEQAVELAGVLIAFAARHRSVLWPGYTHGRRAMPSSVGLWAGAYAEGVLDTVESLRGLWPQVDRSPLGSAAGYGVPLPLKREVSARALGFAGVDRNVATVQGGRGKLEAAALFWCTQLGHELGRLSQDVILFTAEEFGYLVLPADLATGSSIMPHKRNPDLFELTRGGAAALEGDLLSVMQIKAKLGSGYHRDFQLLKEPLMRGLERTGAMLGVVSAAIPRLGVDRARCVAALEGGALATDEVMRRVEGGRAFRDAYREVASALAKGERFPAPPRGRIIARRRSTGGVGNLGLTEARVRLRAARTWEQRQRRRFDAALARLAGEADQPVTADRRKRHLKILELISTRAVHTQEELAEALASEGWDVTQSSVSRDIAALRLIKAGGSYRRPAVASTPVDPDERRIAEGVLTVDRAGDALVVLHTPPGEANRVAVALDRLAWPDVVGTLAGDDTIFLAVKDAGAQRKVIGEVRKLTKI